MTTISKEGIQVYPITVPTPYDVGTVNFFLLEDRQGLILIDAGIDTDPCWDALLLTLAENGFSLQDLKQIWITHNHEDHTGLINRIAGHREIPVYAHPEAVPRLTRDPEFFSMRIEFFDKLYREMGCGAAGERHVEYLKAAVKGKKDNALRAEIIPVSAGDRLASFEVIEVPGHSPDHVVFWDNGRKWLFAGDHLLPHISSNAFVEPNREGERLHTLVQYVNSFEACLSLDAETVFPGHGVLIQEPRALIQKRLNRIKEKSEKLRELIGGGRRTAYEIAQAFYPAKYVNVFAPVMSEIIGLLDVLENGGRVQKQRIDGIWHYETS